MGQAKVEMAVDAMAIDQLATATRATADSILPLRRGSRPLRMTAPHTITMRASRSNHPARSTVAHTTRMKATLAGQERVGDDEGA